MAITRQFLNELTSLNLKPDRSIKKETTSPIITNTQLCYPAQVWDWKVTAIGSISEKQFLFADTIPMSDEYGDLYQPSSNSFSDNYRTFLSFIPEDKFPSKDLLTDAKNKIKLPTGNVADSKTPPGWTKVITEGILRWKPDWIVDPSAYSWQQKVQSGSIKNPATIKIRINKEDNEKNILLESDEGTQNKVYSNFQVVSIKAEAWGQIPIIPGSWFSSAMITLGKNYLSNSEDFFGSKGLLKARITGFYVAYKPSFEFASNQPVHSDTLNSLAKKNSFNILGVSSQVNKLTTRNNNTVMSLQAISSLPLIVAVIVEDF